MDMFEFNEAKAQLQPYIDKALREKTDIAVADLYIAAALYKLAILPIVIEEELPQPICAMVNVPEQGSKKPNIMYLVPVDQV